MITVDCLGREPKAGMVCCYPSISRGRPMTMNTMTIIYIGAEKIFGYRCRDGRQVSILRASLPRCALVEAPCPPDE